MLSKFQFRRIFHKPQTPRPDPQPESIIDTITFSNVSLNFSHDIINQLSNIWASLAIEEATKLTNRVEIGDFVVTFDSAISKLKEQRGW